MWTGRRPDLFCINIGSSKVYRLEDPKINVFIQRRGLVFKENVQNYNKINIFSISCSKNEKLSPEENEESNSKSNSLSGGIQ